MKNCKICQAIFSQKLTLAFIVSFKPYEKEIICKNCRKQLELIDAKMACEGCDRKQEKQEKCEDCKKWHLIYPALNFQNQSIYAYNDFMSELIKKYKFSGDYQVRTVFQAVLKKKIETIYFDYLVVVPVDSKTLESRGFNQVCGLLDVKHEHFLKRNNTIKETQSHKNRHQRLALIQPFMLSSDCPDLTGKVVLIVDDVYTTGRTLLYAVELLMPKVKCVKSITLAR